VPRHVIEQITAWDGLASLATLEIRGFLHRMQSDCSVPARLYALESLIFNFYGFALFETVEQVKRQLSTTPFDALRFTGRDIDLWEFVTRSQFESYIRGDWRRIQDAVRDVTERSGLLPQEIDAVVRTGGSSSIPAFVRILEDIFDPSAIQERPVYTTVVNGLAMYALGLWL